MVPLSLATVIRSSAGVATESEGDQWIRRLADDAAICREWVEDAVAVINQAIRGCRVGTQDPYVTEVTRADARRWHIGWGTAAQATRGEWTQAVAVPPDKGSSLSREARLWPGHIMAGFLAERYRVLEGEDLLLRTYLEVEQGRSRAAATLAHAGARLLLAELDPPATEGEMRAHQSIYDVVSPLRELADRALQEPLGPDETEALLRDTGAARIAIEKLRRDSERPHGD
jgi:hypothetical protein